MCCWPEGTFPPGSNPGPGSDDAGNLYPATPAPFVVPAKGTVEGFRMTWGELPTLAVLFAFLGAGLAGCVATDKGLVLKLGTMMPLTGDLQFLGPDMQSGAKLAIQEVTGADVGLKIEAFHEDDRTGDTTEGPNTFNRLVAKGVEAIVGPCCSGVTESLLGLAKQEQVILASPSATSPVLTLNYDNQGYFFRVTPSDVNQGKVLGRLVQDNNITTVGLMIVNNAYGNAFAGVFQDYYTKTLSGVVVKTEKHPESGATSFSSQVDSLCATPRPQGIVFVSYIQAGVQILKEMQNKGCLNQTKLFSSEGLYSQKLSDEAGKDPQGAWLATGMKGTKPQPLDVTRFNTLFNRSYGHNPEQYTAESYDAVMYLSLAALKAKSTQGKDMVKYLRDVANAPGEKVSDFKKAAQMIQEGQDIDWVGMAHDFTFDERYEPDKGVYLYWTFDANGKLQTIAENKTP